MQHPYLACVTLPLGTLEEPLSRTQNPFLLQVFRFNQSVAHVANGLLGIFRGETRPLLGCAANGGKVRPNHEHEWHIQRHIVPDRRHGSRKWISIHSLHFTFSVTVLELCLPPSSVHPAVKHL